LPGLLRAGRARVVAVTSTAHHTGRPVDPDNPHLHGSYTPWKAYGQSKLANYHFALGLQREFERRGLRAQSLMAHPGLSHTNLQVHTVDQGGAGWSGRFFQWLAARTGMPADRGALPQLRAATDPDAKADSCTLRASSTPVRPCAVRCCGASGWMAPSTHCSPCPSARRACDSTFLPHASGPAASTDDRRAAAAAAHNQGPGCRDAGTGVHAA
jgi:NAD(P)-dependent dehydrogenase (short-subunit alcohol dehydrogenase family)